MSLWASVGVFDTHTDTHNFQDNFLPVRVCGCQSGHQWVSVTPILTPTIFRIVFCQWESVGVISNFQRICRLFVNYVSTLGYLVGRTKSNQ